MLDFDKFAARRERVPVMLFQHAREEPGERDARGLLMLGHLRRTLLTARQCELLDDGLPPFLADALSALSFVPPLIGDTQGRRETNNATRRFVTPAQRDAHPACAALVELLQDSATTGLIRSVCGRSLTGLYLRSEYCQDTDGLLAGTAYRHRGQAVHHAHLLIDTS